MTVSDSSSDRPVILIHGFGSSTDALWRKAGWIDALEAGGREVIGVDLPGHGAQRDNPHRDPADLLLEQAATHGTADAVGFSVGAWALLAAAAEQPARFSRIAVLGAADLVLTQGLHTPAMQQPVIDVLRSAGEPTGNPMAAAILAMIAEAGNDPNAAADFLAADKRFPALEDLARITAATLVVEGGNDEAGPSELIAQAIPHSERLVVEGAGHFAIPADAQCQTSVIAFLSREDR
jgi:pimeloyl-ACP methyl ester carboxylesterase